MGIIPIQTPAPDLLSNTQLCISSIYSSSLSLPFRQTSCKSSVFLAMCPFLSVHVYVCAKEMQREGCADVKKNDSDRCCYICTCGLDVSHFVYAPF